MSPTPRSYRSPPFLLALAGVLLLGASAVHRHAFVGDDAYIAFRYARNLVDGYGLVYNPGDPPVEGFTSPAWVLVVAAGLRLGFLPESISHSLGVLSALAVLLLLLRSSRAAGHPAWVALVAPLGLVLTRAFPAWTTSGLETMAFTAAVTWGLVATALRPAALGGREAAAAWVLALWLRPEGVLIAGVVLGLGALQALTGRVAWRSVAAVGAPPAVALLGLLVARWSLFGDLVPNTARAKVTGLQLEQGWAWLTVANEDLALVAWLPLVGALLWRASAADLVRVGAPAAYLAYVLAVGGDRFEQRFFVPVLPVLAWSAVEGAQRLPRWTRGLIVLVLPWLLAELASRGVARVPPLRHDVESVDFIRTFAARRLAQGQQLRDLVDDGVIPADTRLCVGAAGALPYAAELWSLDYFGLNDRTIAARPPSSGRRIIAHEKRATAQDLVAHGVTMFDGTGHMLAKDLKEARGAWQDLAKKFHKTDGATGVLRRVCHRTGDLRLVFATPQPEAVHDAAWGHLPRCDHELEARASRQ